MTTITDYLQDSAPREVLERIKRLEAVEKKQAQVKHRECVDNASQKPATWLIQFDAFGPGRWYDAITEPTFFQGSGYDLANAQWDLRLNIAPGVSLQQARELTRGIAEGLDNMDPAEFERLSLPEFGERLEAPDYRYPDEVPF